MALELAGVPMVDVIRGERVESTHDVAACACDAGCPSCVGPIGEVGGRGKETVLSLMMRPGRACMTQMRFAR